MQVHQLQPKHSSKNKKRVGRGGKKGSYSGKGGKGQTARSGRKLVPVIRELIKRYPKLKGYRASYRENPVAVINLDNVEKHMKAGDVVTVEELLKKGLVRQETGKTPKVKILGRGALTKKISFEGIMFSKSAKEAVEKAGGSIKA